MTDATDNQIEAVAKALAEAAGEDWGKIANGEADSLRKQAKAAIEASHAQYVPMLVDALRYWYNRYADEDGEALLQNDPLGYCADKTREVLSQLPKEPPI